MKVKELLRIASDMLGEDITDCQAYLGYRDDKKARVSVFRDKQEIVIEYHKTGEVNIIKK